MLEGCSDVNKLRILQQVNIEKYHSLRKKQLENFVSPIVENESLYENMGRIIHNERIKRGLESSKLAANIGMSKKTILNLEKANSRMSMSTLYRICSTLRIPMDYILVEGLDDKKIAIQYLLNDTFKDADVREREFLIQYMKILSEFVTV